MEVFLQTCRKSNSLRNCLRHSICSLAVRSFDVSCDVTFCEQLFSPSGRFKLFHEGQKRMVCEGMWRSNLDENSFSILLKWVQVTKVTYSSSQLLTTSSRHNVKHSFSAEANYTSETDPRSHEATIAVAKKAQKNFWGFSGMERNSQQDPVKASEFFLGFLCSCFSCFITARISFPSNLYPQCIYKIYIIYTLSQI